MVSSTVFNQAPKYYTYDGTGNLTSKTGVGSYTYGLNAGPHAVTAVDNAGVISNYHYDANGSMTSGNGRTLVYNSFNKPTQMANATADIRFSYGADRARVIRQNIVTGELRHYIGSLFERKTLQGLTNYTHYIKAGGSTVAIVNSKSDGANSTHYLHKDHLGSIATITDENGLVIESQSYDAHGKRRNSDWSDIVGNPSPSGTTDRGFTGHEHVDEVGLIHMNGRVYDATLGRFISADPNIQAAYNSQSFNRYSYVLNNPLSYTDPSGFFFSSIKKFFKKVFRGIKNFFKSLLKNEIFQIVATIYLASLGIPPGTFDAMLHGFAMGYIGSGGDFKAGVIGALSFGALSKINKIAAGISGVSKTVVAAGKTLAHGVVGGVASVANGGKFKHGFGTMAFKEAVGVPNTGNGAGDIVLNAAIGGTSSALGGGKFADGARTSGFIKLFSTASKYMREVAEGWAKNNKEYYQLSIGSSGAAEVRLAGVTPMKGGYLNSFWEFFNFGGQQLSSKRHIFGFEYDKYSLTDYVLEAVAGPHDFLDGILYDRANGYTLDLGLFTPVGTAYSILTVPVALPFAIAPYVDNPHNAHFYDKKGRNKECY